ncbi:hypothetical protein [Acidocella aminolytica]|uniref:Uncharacterized protein n=1 Tax=Acidocella aminolytica 101 = DSM 11237 TaxID=1120923 RepID=A0A0D6PFZ2_9PROT|nr:hypothetical protein [Acidocella aminolytica]GAN79779.1 hypothetical protein Aam_030_012 [Acidocella aminolytica 101 = DSM 11237]GBQ32030.1 hypothetical protein AA11237_0047 [Acidocella aminolytica 101 = DSM 11237]SHF35734.1 hypothetical protein SAMN02746095_02953 [Acidocella aminolytica 101 = DSM 11237]
MDAATIQAKIWAGYGKAASRVGALYQQFRPTDPLAPMAKAKGTIYAAFDAGNYKFNAPQGYGKPTWRALLDGRSTAVGDILKGAGGTFFIVGQDALLPILAVQANATVTVYKAAAPAGYGVQPYGGDVEATRQEIMAGWPASILSGSHTPENGPVGLPGDARTPWKEVLLPAIAGVTITTDNFITDSAGARFQVSDAELTSMGWRLAATQREA